MKISVNLSSEDLKFLDSYTRVHQASPVGCCTAGCRASPRVRVVIGLRGGI